MENENQQNLLLLQELTSLDNDAIVAIIRSSEEESLDRLQLAWQILDERGLKDAVLSKIEQEDETKKLSIDDLLHPENEEKISDNTFADKIEFVVGSEIKVNERDILGVYKGLHAKEVDLDTRKISREEKEIFIKKFRIQLILSAFSFILLIIVYTAKLSFYGEIFIEWGLLFHTLFRIFMAFSTYMSFKNEN